VRRFRNKCMNGSPNVMPPQPTFRSSTTTSLTKSVWRSARAKDLRLIRSVGYDDKELREIGLLDGLIWDGYKTRNDLDVLLGGKLAPKNKWAQAKRDTKQPIYVVSPSTPNTTATKLFSAVKKQTRFKFRSFKAWEIGRLSAHEAWEQVALSSGVVVTWEEGEGVEVRRSNQRAALVYGMARGRGIPALLIAHKKALLPADLKEQAARWSDLQHIDGLLRDFRDDVQDELNELEEEQPLPIALLDAIDCGDAAAENEQERLKRYFLETEEFKRTLSGAANLVVGRKGSGKSAIFLQTRDRVRADKKNIVVDLNPEGYQLIKLKELLVELQSQGTRKEFIAAFWQYVLWLEIAYKILEKDERLARRDSFLGERYAKLSDAFRQRVDTGAGDFSERLRLLTEMIGRRFSERADGKSVLNSSEVLEVVYGADIAGIRDEVLSYLHMKGKVLFLFDNLDRMRTPSGFNDDDALIIVGLVESLQEIAKRFRRGQIDFTWVLFVRSDVYAVVVSAMADYGKLSQQVLEWNDRELLKKVIQKRILDSAPSTDHSWDRVWEAISVATVKDRDTMDFLVESSLMRPRYLIRMFETAKRRAVNMGHQRIQEDDFLAALEELGWTVMEDLDRSSLTW
jgi:hypothetical protein